ncbi:organic cation transporter protein isoform X2 [Toxorhynchites rutilus septentrionalis]|uniref:organic cation transporter protein isoform X2 n=1 Tax=Toxorhynchites rutilus septentrionalis TaxID=329112 RepID=UPI00247AF7DA|nr:organic cation transporter protein isoform X2 [Toxorhynchites rutilus septentrionalis]
MVDLLSSIMGDFGKWQCRAIFLIYLCKIPSSWFMACLIFTAPAPKREFFCKPPVPVPLLNATEWIKISHPVIEEVNDEEFAIDYCNVFEDAMEHSVQYFKTTEVKPWIQPKNDSKIIPCEAFEHHAAYNSIITQFDLVCSRDILVATTQFFHLFGVLLGGIITTKLLETISPKNTMLLGMYTQIVCGCITGLVNVFELHMLFRCLSAICCGLMYTAGGMIISDIAADKYRTASICFFEQFWSVGVMILPGIASFWSNWSHLYLAISLPTFLLIILHRWIPDSPRWLLHRNRVEEAKAILMECAEINGSTNYISNDFDIQLKSISETFISKPNPDPWWSIWKEKLATKNLVCVHLAWSIFIVVYYGMLLNIRAFGTDHLRVNTVIAGASEMLGTFVGFFLIMSTEKKWFWTGLLNIVGGLSTYLAWIIPTIEEGNERVALLMLTAMVSKASISCCLSVLITCTTELVPVEKKIGLSYSSTVWARIWLLGAPFIGATIIFGQLIPQTIFGSLTILGGIIVGSIDSPKTHKSLTKCSIHPENIYTEKPIFMINKLS